MATYSEDQDGDPRVIDYRRPAWPYSEWEQVEIESSDNTSGKDADDNPSNIADINADDKADDVIDYVADVRGNDKDDNATDEVADDKTGDKTDDTADEHGDDKTDDVAGDKADNDKNDFADDVAEVHGNVNAENVTGDKTDDVAENVSGDKTDNVAENVTGDKTDNVAENVTGDKTDDVAENVTGDKTDDVAGDKADNVKDGVADDVADVHGNDNADDVFSEHTYHDVNSEDDVSDSNSLKILLDHINSPDVAETEEAKQTSSLISLMIDKTMKKLSKSYKLFKGCYMLAIGSMAEKSKVYKPDEFDFAIVLPAIADVDVFALLLREESIMSDRRISELVNDTGCTYTKEFIMNFSYALRQMWADEMPRNAADDWEILETTCCLDDVSSRNISYQKTRRK